MKNVLITLFALAMISYSFDKIDDHVGQSKTAKNESTPQANSPESNDFVATNNTPCNYKYDVYICPTSACCEDSTDCVYDTTSYVDSMSTDSSLSYLGEYSICKIVVTELSSSAQCTIGKPSCGYNTNCIHHSGCKGNRFIVNGTASGFTIRP